MGSSSLGDAMTSVRAKIQKLRDFKERLNARDAQRVEREIEREKVKLSRLKAKERLADLKEQSRQTKLHTKQLGRTARKPSKELRIIGKAAKRGWDYLTSEGESAPEKRTGKGSHSTKRGGR